MGHAFHQLYYHFAWATHSRIQLIRRDHRPKILTIINEEAKKRGGWPVRHNAMPDHVHLFGKDRRINNCRQLRLLVALFAVGPSQL